MNEEDADVGERLYFMSLHGRILLVYLFEYHLTLKKLGSPAKALSMLIRCVDLSERYNARMVYLGAVSLLCKVMNELNQPQEAFRILRSIMPSVLLAARLD